MILLVLRRAGFNVTSVEYMPIDEVSSALKLWAPSVKLLDGDGHVIIPQLIDSFGRALASKTMVIFDGEKRMSAYRNTFVLIKDRIAVAAFDDSDVGAVWDRHHTGRNFHDFLEMHGEIWWETNETNPAYKELMDLEGPHITLYSKSPNEKKKVKLTDGSIALVVGGGWNHQYSKRGFHSGSRMGSAH
mmetsp:Transcript_11730/g.28978  ORF Transcript_11730/g.28978 Transcript_11730/m.28978 type:complete len:188 (+) Transcript_11730:680-1243(+)